MRPDLTDAAARVAYRRELMSQYRGWRWLGLAVVAVAVGRMLWRGAGFDAITIALLVGGWAVLIAVIVARTRYHRRRMAEPPAAQE